METNFFNIKKAGYKLILLINALSVSVVIFFPQTGFSQNQIQAININTSQQNIQTNKLHKSLLNLYNRHGQRDTVVQSGEGTIPYEKKIKLGGEGKHIKGVVLPELYVASIIDTAIPPKVAGNKSLNRGLAKTVFFRILIDTIQPLIYNAATNKYVGVLSILLVEDSDSLLLDGKLKDPVPIELSIGANATAVPSIVQIDHVNLPRTIINITDNSQVNPVPIRVITNFNTKGYTTYLIKEKILLIETPSRSLQGFGVQTIPINISLQGYTGNDSVNVTIDVDKGIVNPNKIKLTKNTSGTVSLTSEGIGDVNIKVSAQEFTSGQKQFRFVFPWMFILFALIGGLVGSVIKYLMTKGKKNIFRILALGLLTGIAFAILYYVLGIEVFATKLSRNVNEFAVLGISFLGALFWGNIYNLISGKLFGSRKGNVD